MSKANDALDAILQGAEPLQAYAALLAGAHKTLVEGGVSQATADAIILTLVLQGTH
jgi:hypothetical protein